MSLERALELAERGRGTTYPNPVVGAVLRAGRRGGRRGLARAERRAARGGQRDRRGRRAGARRDALRDDGALLAPRQHAAVRGRGAGGRDNARRRRARSIPCRSTAAASSGLRAAGVETELVDSFEARRQNEAWRTWAAQGPSVRHVQGRGHARRPRHACPAPAGSRARRAAGSSTSSAPRRTPSRSGWERCGRTIRGSTPATWTPPASRGGSPSAEGRCHGIRSSSCSRARWRTSWRSSVKEGVQSLLLEGGPTLATAFLEAGLVDKLLVFLAPVVGGAGPRFLGDLSRPRPALPARHASGRQGHTADRLCP